MCEQEKVQLEQLQALQAELLSSRTELETLKSTVTSSQQVRSGAVSQRPSWMWRQCYLHVPRLHVGVNMSVAPRKLAIPLPSVTCEPPYCLPQMTQPESNSTFYFFNVNISWHVVINIKHLSDIEMFYFSLCSHMTSSVLGLLR